MPQFDSILVANRGEIALRVIRSARQQGYRTIAVFSDADADAPHVELADQAVNIGAAPAKDSYLDIEKILSAARVTGAQAVHPGYGFLSENPDFALACEAAGIQFIGPSADAIRVMGNKGESKRRMIAARVPCIPGYEGLDQSDDTLIEQGGQIGVPIMVKATAGGGGRGMRLVRAPEELRGAIQSARSEAESAFGSGELILEKAVLNPRHIEIQVFGDSHGNVIHLGERDCSVQRRHQKVVEEAPSPLMTPELRARMGQAAVDAAKSINYVGAGTVEFLVDEDRNFYFLEMNTRLQVEHPVTEMVTGTDLVSLQFHVAQGYPLPLKQSDVDMRGHAIEVRLYAEDTENGFLPASGRADHWRVPGGDGIRVDHGLNSGQSVTPFYDPMIAKIIAWGDDRDIARRRLRNALQSTCLFGVTNNREFLLDVLDRPDFIEGPVTTAFITRNYGSGSFERADFSPVLPALGAILLHRSAVTAGRIGPDSALEGWHSSQDLRGEYAFAQGEAELRLQVKALGAHRYAVGSDGSTEPYQIIKDDGEALRFQRGDVRASCFYAFGDSGEVNVQLDGTAAVFRNELANVEASAEGFSDGGVHAPMHGSVVDVLVEVGQSVAAGETLAVIEAMKMEHVLVATIDGVVTQLNARAGAQIAAGDLLILVEDSNAQESDV
ncbi:MAG: acetyl/propionyl/methylcrotonyl-CoA carboxylase subunit alpha [Pseudomonadota bacterium]